MKRGFVFGKFYPFHIGHQQLIEFAHQQCDQLLVLVCASTIENISGGVRKNWLENTFNHIDSIEIQLFVYDENEFPNSSVSSRQISQIWANLFLDILSPIDILFTSEPYGEYVAEFMNIQHQAFDYQRNTAPISSTQIRKNPLKYWQYLPQAVKPYYLKKVALLGTESTGKSTLSQQLASYFKTNFVPEKGREIVPQSEECSFDDLGNIALSHAHEIINQSYLANKLLFIDTDIHITASYGNFLFNRKLVVEDWIKEANQADLYLYLGNDVPFVQDGTRLTEKHRNDLDQSHLKTLRDARIPFHYITGDWKERQEKAISLVSKLLITS